MGIRIGSKLTVGFGLLVGLTLLVVALAASYFLGVDPAMILGLVEQNNPAAPSHEQNQVPANDPMSQFVRVVLADTEDAWQSVFQQHGRDYRPPTLVLFSGSTPTARRCAGSPIPERSSSAGEP